MNLPCNQQKISHDTNVRVIYGFKTISKSLKLPRRNLKLATYLESKELFEFSHGYYPDGLNTTLLS